MATVAEKRRGSSALWLTVLLALFVIINYVDRGAVGIAAPKLKAELGVDHKQFGLAVSAFAWIYAPAQFFIGWLTARICVYRLLAGGLVLWALATFGTGFVGGLAALVTMRFLLGIGEGVADEGAHDPVGGLFVGKRGEVRDLIRRHDRNGLGHIEPAVPCKAGQHRLAETQDRSRSPGRNIAHSSVLRFVFA